MPLYTSAPNVVWFRKFVRELKKGEFGTLQFLSIVTIATKNNTFEYNDGDGTLFAKSNQTVKIVLEIKSCAMLLVLLLPLLVLF